MRGPRVTGNPAAGGNPVPAGDPAAGNPLRAADPEADNPAAAAGNGARTVVTPRGQPAAGGGLPAGERGPSPALGAPRLTEHCLRLAGRCLRLAREHWLLTVLLAAGLVLRAAAQIAYRPALIYIDSLRYLYHAHGADPVGYRVLLRPLLLVGNLDLVAAFQHVVGLAMAVLLYVVLLRRGVPRWLAALATAPVLLDGYQLQIEQTIMPDVMFEACIAAGLAALLWHPRPRTALVITGGLFLGASATARQVGEIFLLPALAYLLVALPHWRRRLAQGAILCAAFTLPILAYCSVALAVTGHFRLSYTGTNEFYGRLALAVDCREVAFPAGERALCPSHARAVQLGIDGLEHNPASPLRRYQAGHPGTFSAAVAGFDRRLLLHDPAAVAVAAGRDALKLYAVDRVTAPGDSPVRRWQFQRGYPFYPAPLYASAITGQVVATAGRQFGGGGPAVARPLASFLRVYQLGGGYTPGPLLALATLAGLAGTLSLARRHATPAQRHAAQACLLMFTSAAAVLLISDAFEFSWRYQLPALITLPPAAALALTALFTHRQSVDH
jgi:Dolichyl-phosphate-mannose-protein mannosyltransferase